MKICLVLVTMFAMESIPAQDLDAAAVKKARNLALLPSGTDAYDVFHRAELISPVPFEA